MAKPFHSSFCRTGSKKRRISYEPGADGKPQAVLPGAERHDQRFTRKVIPVQKPCDIGLFSDDANQLDLCEMFMDGEEEP